MPWPTWLEIHIKYCSEFWSRTKGLHVISPSRYQCDALTSWAKTLFTMFAIWTAVFSHTGFQSSVDRCPRTWSHCWSSFPFFKANNFISIFLFVSSPTENRTPVSWLKVKSFTTKLWASESCLFPSLHYFLVYFFSLTLPATIQWLPNYEFGALTTWAKGQCDYLLFCSQIVLHMSSCKNARSHDSATLSSFPFFYLL